MSRVSLSPPTSPATLSPPAQDGIANGFVSRRRLLDDDNDEDNDDEDGEQNDEKEDDPSVVPLTPSQIKAQQPAGRGYQRQSPQKSHPQQASKVAEEDSNQTSPTVSSTVEDDNDKSPNVGISPSPGKASTKSLDQEEEAKPPKRHLLKRSDRQEQTKIPARQNNVPIAEIRFSDEAAPKPSEIRARTSILPRGDSRHTKSPSRIPLFIASSGFIIK